MDKRVLKWITALTGLLTVLCCVLLNVFPKIHDQAVLAAERQTLIGEDLLAVMANAKVQNPEQVVKEDKKMKEQLRIELPENINENEFEVTNDYVTQTVFIRILTEEENYFSNYRVSGSCDHIATLSYYKQSDTGVIALGLDQVYELRQEFREGCLYLNFVDPHDIYDKVVVVDAGHGSKAAGVSKLDVMEKDINLGIVLKLKELLDKNEQNIGVYYTRTTDSNPSLQQRVRLANKAHADLFVSIHNNSSQNGNFSNLHGTQVMFSESDHSKLSSKKFAEICLNEVSKALNSKRIGLLEGDKIYIIRTSEVPVALVEVGFITNREELGRLKTPEYQKKAADGVYQAIMKAIEKGY